MAVRKAPGSCKTEESAMYIFVEYTTVVALIALTTSLLFAAMTVIVTIEQGIHTLLRTSQRAGSTGTLARALERAR
jgi:hypothetical protein